MTAPFESFTHLLNTCPHQLRTVFVSDLHLSIDEPALMQAFLALLHDLLTLPNLKRLYILGDWFDAWIGDDSYLQLDDKAKANHWLTPMFTALKSLRIQGCDILVMRGNRDFLLGQPLCNVFAGRLIAEPTLIDINEFINPDALTTNQSNTHFSEPTHTLRLEHGDALCTDDKAYQCLRYWTRNPLLQWWLLNKPLHKRQQIAHRLRKKSQQSNSKKSESIMDVNATAVKKALTQADTLLHGHTHRPAIHKLPNKQRRLVLGDWRKNILSDGNTQVSAVIGVLLNDDDNMNGWTALRLVNFVYQFSNMISTQHR